MSGPEDTASQDSSDTISQLKQEVKEAEGALERLMAAYDAQEAELKEFKTENETLNRELIDKETEKEGINNLLSNLRRQKDEMELELAKANTKIPFLESKLDKNEELLEREKARLGQLMTVAEDLDDTNNAAQAELAARDDWYVQHMQIFEDLNEAIKTRHDMIDRAIENAKEIQSKQESFHAQKKVVIEEIKEMEEDNPEKETQDGE